MQTVNFSTIPLNGKFIWDNFVFTKVDQPEINAISNKGDGYLFEQDDKVICLT